MPRNDAAVSQGRDSTLELIQCEVVCDMLSRGDLGGFFSLLAVACEVLDALECAGVAGMMANPKPPNPTNHNAPGFNYLAHAPAWQRQAPKFRSGMGELRFSGPWRFSPTPAPSRKPKPN